MKLINYQSFFRWLVSEYTAGQIKVELEFNDIVYDKNFAYNSQTDSFIADSTKYPDISFGCDGKTLANYISTGIIDLTIS